MASFRVKEWVKQETSKKFLIYIFITYMYWTSRSLDTHLD
jgi:hypothetical protein